MVRRLFLACLLGLAACAPITQDKAADTAAIRQEIVDVCLLSPLFKDGNSLIGAVVPAPGVALGADLVNAGITVVCANPDRFAAVDAVTAEWIVSRSSKTAAWVKKVIADHELAGKLSF
jgi:hypothetical protein